MTGPDLIRLAEELARCGGMHRLTNLVTAAVHVTLEHERRAEAEDGPCGAGMSDRVVVSRRVEAAPAADGECDCAEEPAEPRPTLASTPDGLAAIDLYRAAKLLADGLATSPVCRCGATMLSNPAPTMPERGERQPIPFSDCQGERGITHGPDSPVAREFGRPVDPAAEQGDCA